MNVEQRRHRYQTDPEYRERERQRSRESYHRLKKLTGEKTGPKARSPEERFWEKVNRGSDDACWLWQGASRNQTFPSISVDGRSIPAYRFSFELHFGPLTPDQCVRSGCKTRLCVNPHHMYLDNLDGVRNPKILKLTAEEALKRIQARSKKARDNYQKNSATIRVRSAEHQMKNKIRAINYLGGRCTRCGFNHPSALQFHHREPSTKLFSITSKELSTPKKRPWATSIIPELDKCDLLCSNCHFVEHAVLDPERVRELQDEL